MRKLERKYADELVVIGVHSAKFPAEKSTEAIRHAVRRLAVGHPVVNDADFRVWREYAVRCWPTLMFLDPHGKVIGYHEGEFNLEALDDAIAEMVAEFEREGTLDRRPLSFTAEGENDSDRPLYFPGKLLVDARRMFVADTGHHRILEVMLPTGQVRRVFGCGEKGFADGPAGEAAFSSPQGLALAGDSLFVADTENHAIRRIRLDGGTVETVAGTGEQDRGPSVGGAALLQDLSSPWDLAVDGERLFVAMAGRHQIWVVHLGHGIAEPFAGNGCENIADGPRHSAQLAQPSGLALDREAGLLYVADSEVSGVRSVEVGPNGWVRTLVGQGLFEFGDADGVGEAVRLQHPLALAWADAVLYVADSYNHKIKSLNPRTREVRTAFGTGEPGRRDGLAAEATFSEPGGLSFADGRLYVADTNNHAVRVCDLATGAVTTLPLVV